MKAELRDRVQELTALAAGLMGTCDFRVEVSSDGWSWSPADRIISVKEDALMIHGPRFCAGIIAHEVGHALLTRPLQRTVPVSVPLSPGAVKVLTHRLHNAMEDTRVEHGMAILFPGVGDWIVAVHAEEKEMDARSLEDPMLACIQFMLGALLEAREGWPETSDPALDPMVAEALNGTRVLRKGFACLLPEGWPELEGRSEARVLKSMQESMDLLELVIHPEIVKLVARDLLCIENFIDRHPRILDVGGRAVNTLPGAARSIVKRAVADGQHDVLGHDRSARMARLVLSRYFDPPKGGDVHDRTAAQRRLKALAQKKRSKPRSRGDQIVPYATIRNRIGSQIVALQDEMEQALSPTRRSRLESGHSHGIRVDVRRLVRCEANPRLKKDFWKRRGRPDTRKAAVSLLVDLSGSMKGEKVRAAVAGTVLFAEVLNRLQVPFSISGFHTERVAVCGFGEGLTEAVKERIAQMPSKTGGENADGPMLSACAGELLDQAVDDRLFIVLSDGRPTAGEDPAGMLNQAVAECSAAGIRLVGLGLGPQTGHVIDFYPNAVAEVPLEGLSSRIGGVLRSLV